MSIKEKIVEICKQLNQKYGADFCYLVVTNREYLQTENVNFSFSLTIILNKVPYEYTRFYIHKSTDVILKCWDKLYSEMTSKDGAIYLAIEYYDKKHDSQGKST